MWLALEPESLSGLPALAELSLLLPTTHLASHPVGSASPHNPLDASDTPCSGYSRSMPAWIWGPRAPGLPVQRLLLCSQTPTGVLLRLQ